MDAMTSSRGWRWPFVLGIAFGLVALLGVRTCVNYTYVPDRIVSPLLVESDQDAADAIVVLGASVVGACTPGHSGVRRVMHAVRLWRDRRAPFILITGGSGPSPCPVSRAMADMARELGVPDHVLRIEPVSRSTAENASLGGVLLRGWGVRRVILVSDRLHLTRARAAFQAQGFDVRLSAVPIYEGHEDNVSMLIAGLREYIALGYYWTRGWLAPAGLSASAPRAVPAMSAPQYPDGPLVLLGASYAQAWSVQAIGGVPVVNRGLAGQQSFELMERFERDVVSARPRAVLLWGFINDIFRAPQSDLEPALARIRSSYEQMIAAARQAGIEPILATEVTARPQGGTLTTEVVNVVASMLGKTAYQDRINQPVMATNRWLRELAAREGLLLLDFETTLAEPGGRRRRSFAQPDGSHITDAGYAMLAAYAIPLLEEHLRER